MIRHVLTTSPQAEFHVRDELHWLGHAALVPVAFRWRTHAFGKKIKAPTPQRVQRVPGYVFAAFEREPNWFELERVRGWTGLVFADGRLATLSRSQFDAIEALSVPIQAIKSPESKYRAGDRVRILRGANAELEAIVETIKNGKVVATVDLLGKRHRTTVALDALQAHPG